jgi:hypothetical protein
MGGGVGGGRAAIKPAGRAAPTLAAGGGRLPSRAGAPAPHPRSSDLSLGSGDIQFSASDEPSRSLDTSHSLDISHSLDASGDGRGAVGGVGARPRQNAPAAVRAGGAAGAEARAGGAGTQVLRVGMQRASVASLSLTGEGCRRGGWAGGCCVWVLWEGGGGGVNLSSGHACCTLPAAPDHPAGQTPPPDRAPRRLNRLFGRQRLGGALRPLQPSRQARPSLVVRCPWAARQAVDGSRGRPGHAGGDSAGPEAGRAFIPGAPGGPEGI